MRIPSVGGFAILMCLLAICAVELPAQDYVATDGGSIGAYDWAQNVVISEDLDALSGTAGLSSATSGNDCEVLVGLVGVSNNAQDLQSCMSGAVATRGPVTVTPPVVWCGTQTSVATYRYWYWIFYSTLLEGNEVNVYVACP